jgi:alginate O-acetyltransferase complex protein AlgI
MLFNTTSFFVFLAVVLALFYASPRRFRKYILLLASYYFYATWNYTFIVLLLTLTVIDYTAGILLERAEQSGRRRALLVMSLAANLGFLGFFKYYNFLASNIALLLHRPENAFALAIVLPLGISFHTFQSISYVVDVYRRQQRAIRNPIDYALFICFFPQLVAGPIVRAREFFTDLFHWRPPEGLDVGNGLFLLTLGLCKKMAFADRFALVANDYFNNLPAHSGRLTAWCGVFAFGLQIFFDFSGYTDMAIGMAKLLGFHFPENFRRPYLASSITDFWRRWHISLSRWLRDYLYIPLGGNRLGPGKTYRNLLVTMLLGGLWHGASWNFLIWGGYHGLLLAIERAFRRGRKPSPPRPILYPFQAAATFLLVLFGWVFFRAATFAQSKQVLAAMFAGPPGPTLFHPWHIGLAALALVLALLEERWDLSGRIIAGPGWRYALALALILFCTELFGVTGEQIPFIYFQF